ncbi:hypothetical protein CHS0354_022546 [Potamilus streckersoni]|uniref:Biogenesis of lysosome-related organelles complex 1 subunit 4 n=1 Tax=Potamilus streckersoni TaxID=2493646 RepID=A0AAE0TBI3_9BIVA|nr:hypothetical protein CHS0354_022546 [Potamilus streckersoni]
MSNDTCEETAENENVEKSIRELSKDYSEFIEIDSSREQQKFNDSIEEMLTKLEEFSGLVDMIRSDTSLCMNKTLPQIKAKCDGMKKIFTRIDRLEAFAAFLREQLKMMEECVNKAESEMGSLSGIKKMFSSLISPKKLQPKGKESKLEFLPPEMFVTEEYVHKITEVASTEKSPDTTSHNTEQTI